MRRAEQRSHQGYALFDQIIDGIHVVILLLYRAA